MTIAAENSHDSEKAEALCNAVDAISIGSSTELLSEHELLQVSGSELPLADCQSIFDSASVGPQANEVFRDSSAFDFLSKHGDSDTRAAAMSLARQSLYVKFDPLIAGRPSILPGRSTTETAKDIRSDLITMQSPPRESTSLPCENGGTTHDATHNNGNDDSVLDASKSTSSSYDASKEPVCGDQPTDMASRLAFEEQLLIKDTHILQLEKDIVDAQHELGDVQTQLLNSQHDAEKIQQVLIEYEKSIAELISEKDKERARLESEHRALINEKNQLAEDVNNVERAFADIHRKYERIKQAVEDFKQNEETLKVKNDELVCKLKRQDQKYDKLRSHAEATLELANKEIERLKEVQESESIRMTATLRKLETKVKSLELTLDQKVKENQELTAICDDLLSKVGRQ